MLLDGHHEVADEYNQRECRDRTDLSKASEHYGCACVLGWVGIATVMRTSAEHDTFFMMTTSRICEMLPKMDEKSR